MNKQACAVKPRKDDIPKRKGEKTWACDTCGAVLFSKTKPACVRDRLADARTQAASEANRLHLED